MIRNLSEQQNKIRILGNYISFKQEKNNLYIFVFLSNFYE
jgi:hypothetical protein